MAINATKCAQQHSVFNVLVPWISQFSAVVFFQFAYKRLISHNTRTQTIVNELKKTKKKQIITVHATHMA